VFSHAEYSLCDLISVSKSQLSDKRRDGELPSFASRSPLTNLICAQSFLNVPSSGTAGGGGGVIRLATSHKLRLNNWIILMDLILDIAAVLLHGYVFVGSCGAKEFTFQIRLVPSFPNLIK
jgi:hypothetical protein